MIFGPLKLDLSILGADEWLLQCDVAPKPISPQNWCTVVRETFGPPTLANSCWCSRAVFLLSFKQLRTTVCCCCRTVILGGLPDLGWSWTHPVSASRLIRSRTAFSEQRNWRPSCWLDKPSRFPCNMSSQTSVLRLFFLPICLYGVVTCRWHKQLLPNTRYVGKEEENWCS